MNMMSSSNNLNMNTIDIISTNSNFSDNQKQTINSIIQLLIGENSQISTERVQFIGQVLFAISIWKGDVNLVRWCLENNYGSASELITNSHIAFVNQLGFNMETISDMGTDRNSPDNIQDIDLDEDQ